MPNTAAKGSTLVLESALTCPQCGAKTIETMPTDACIVFYECANCHVLLRPKPGECCVFCSYGSVKCPPIQQSQDCCDSAGEGATDEVDETW
ncbi:MAG: GDCCVxC domain-containing (seleno)protein [Steroidobacteraceae bacterium]